MGLQDPGRGGRPPVVPGSATFPAVGPRLRKLLLVVFVLFRPCSPSTRYTWGTITWFEWWSGNHAAGLLLPGRVSCFNLVLGFPDHRSGHRLRPAGISAMRGSVPTAGAVGAGIRAVFPPRLVLLLSGIAPEPASACST